MDFEDAYPEITRIIGYQINRHRHSLTRKRYDPDDVGQDILIKVMRSWSQYDQKRGTLSTWVSRVANNAIIDLYRRKFPETVSIEDVSEPEVEINLEDRIHLAELSSDLPEALENLSPKYGQLLYMRFFMEMTYQEIADATRSPLGTVKTGIHRAKNQLKEHLL